MDEPATEPTPAQRLRALYERIPAIACKRRCQDFCVAVVDDGALSVLERERIYSLHGQRPPQETHRAADLRGGHICGYLDEVGRCSIYPLRPLVCRLFGALDVPGMRCPYGCKPERYLTPAEGHALMLEVTALGGGKAAPGPLGLSEREQQAGMLRMVIGYAAERAEDWDVLMSEGVEGLRGIARRMRP